MKRTLMVFTAIAAFVVPAAAPLTVLAQEETVSGQEGPPRQRGRNNGGQQRQERPDGREEPRAEQPQRPDRPNRPQRPDDEGRRPDRPDRPQQPQQPQQPRGDRPDRPNRPDRPDRPQRPDRPDRPNDGRGGWEGRQDRPNDGRGRPDRPNDGRGGDGRGGRDGRPDRPNRPGGDNDGRGRPDRPNDGRWNDNRGRDRDHREFRNRFNRDHWRNNWNRRHSRPDWWRNDRFFRGWSGVRIGFYFAPGVGYYSVPRNYWGQRYYEGDYLPSLFWRYELRDYAYWGLPYAPAGTMWVFVDNNIYLVDRYDGYVIEAIYDAWRW